MGSPIRPSWRGWKKKEGEGASARRYLSSAKNPFIHPPSQIQPRFWVTPAPSRYFWHRGGEGHEHPPSPLQREASPPTPQILGTPAPLFGPPGPRQSPLGPYRVFRPPWPGRTGTGTPKSRPGSAGSGPDRPPPKIPVRIRKNPAWIPRIGSGPTPKTRPGFVGLGQDRPPKPSPDPLDWNWINPQILDWIPQIPNCILAQTPARILQILIQN